MFRTKESIEFIQVLITQHWLENDIYKNEICFLRSDKLLDIY